MLFAERLDIATEGRPVDVALSMVELSDFEKVDIHSPVWLFLRRSFTATVKLMTGVPLAVERSSASRVRLPLIVARLMLMSCLLVCFVPSANMGKGEALSLSLSP